MNLRTSSALSDAVRGGRIEEVKELLSRGASVNATNKFGNTPLGWACQAGKVEIVKALLSHGADANQRALNGITPLVVACRSGQFEVAEELLANGAICTEQKIDEQSPLHEACLANNVSIVKLLLDRGADIEFRGCEGRTALHIICLYQGSLSLAQELLSRGAALDICDNRGRLPIHYARGKILEEVVHEMLSRGSRGTSINWQDRNGCTFLHCAARYGELGLVQMLLNDGADLDQRANEGESALIFACDRGRLDSLEIVRELLSRGAMFNMSEVESRVKSDELRIVLEAYASEINYVMK